MSRRVRASGRALVLARAPYGESSLVVRVLTAEHGPQRLLARGAHRAKSAFAWTLDLFDELELRWSTPQHGGLGNLEAGTVRIRRRRIPADLERYRAALCGLELADLVARPGEDEGALFAGLGALLQALDAEGPLPAPAEGLLATFEARLLADLGLMPALEGCAVCGGTAPADQPSERGSGPRAPFSSGAGGRLCRACALEARNAGRRVGTLAERDLLALQQAGSGQPPADADRAHKAHEIAARFLDYHLDTLPRTHQRFASAPRP
jgi:DNA repair protein RecO